MKERGSLGWDGIEREINQERIERKREAGGREFRTANYVNCRCCKLPSQFAFILNTILQDAARTPRPESIHSDTVTFSGRPQASLQLILSVFILFSLHSYCKHQTNKHYYFSLFSSSVRDNYIYFKYMCLNFCLENFLAIFFCQLRICSITGFCK